MCVPRVFERSSNGTFNSISRAYASRVFQGSFSGCFKEVLRDVQKSLKGVSLKVEYNSNWILV